MEDAAMLREPAGGRDCCEIVTEFRFMVAWRYHACTGLPLSKVCGLPLKYFTEKHGMTRKNIRSLRYIRTRRDR
jgi:hypothetical protein